MGVALIIGAAWFLVAIATAVVLLWIMRNPPEITEREEPTFVKRQPEVTVVIRKLFDHGCQAHRCQHLTLEERAVLEDYIAERTGL